LDDKRYTTTTDFVSKQGAKAHSSSMNREEIVKRWLCNFIVSYDDDQGRNQGACQPTPEHPLGSLKNKDRTVKYNFF
jgi:hypothetical protein